MSNFKSKVPTVNEVFSIVNKFCKDMGHSVSGIIKEYKEKRCQQPHDTTKCTSHAHKKTAKHHDGHKEAHTEATHETPAKDSKGHKESH